MKTVSGGEQSGTVPQAKRVCLDSVGRSETSNVTVSGVALQTVPDLNQPVQNFLSPSHHNDAKGAGRTMGGGECHKGGVSARPQSREDLIVRQSLLDLVPASVRISSLPEKNVRCRNAIQWNL